MTRIKNIISNQYHQLSLAERGLVAKLVQALDQLDSDSSMTAAAGCLRYLEPVEYQPVRPMPRICPSGRIRVKGR